MNTYVSDKTGELIPTVIVQFDRNYPNLWMTKNQYEEVGKMKGLVAAGYPLRNIVKVHHLLKNSSKFPIREWP